MVPMSHCNKQIYYAFKPLKTLSGCNQIMHSFLSMLLTYSAISSVEFVLNICAAILLVRSSIGCAIALQMHFYKVLRNV
jgi:hypothetical protein